MKTDNMIQTAVRLPENTIKSLDKLAKKLSSSGLKASRSDAIRVAVLKGLEVLKEDDK